MLENQLEPAMPATAENNPDLPLLAMNRQVAEKEVVKAPSSKRWLIYAVVAVLLLAGAWAIFVFIKNKNERALADQRASQRVTAAPIFAMGKVLPLGYVITVAMPSGAGDARVSQLLVAEGDAVKIDQVLALLDNASQLNAAVNVARATLSVKQSALSQSQAAVNASRLESVAALKRAEAVYKNSLTELARDESLLAQGFISASAATQRRASVEEASQDVLRQKATLARYEVATGSVPPDVLLAQSNVQAAQVDLTRAVQDQDKSRVKSPIDGSVLTIHARPGEKPGSNGVMSLGNTQRMMVEFEVYQNYIGRIAVGDAVEANVGPIGKTVRGSVTKIGREVSRQTLIDISPAANTDARVFKVTAELDEVSSTLTRNLSQMQVTVKLQGPHQ
jgi:HlyD family secretion protein